MQKAGVALSFVAENFRALKDRYESPADLAHKEEFTARRTRELMDEVGFTDVTTSLYDFLDYPLTGNYIDLFLRRSRALMGMLCRLENFLEEMTVLRSVLDLVAWRLLVVATKPG